MLTRVTSLLVRHSRAVISVRSSVLLSRYSAHLTSQQRPTATHSTLYVVTRTQPSRTWMRIHSRPLVRAARDVQWTRGKKGKETKGKETKAQPESEGDELDLEATRAEMETVIGTATKELSGLRIGRADPALVEHVYVNGEPLRSLAQLHVRDATALVVTAYDASQTAELVAAIQTSQGPFPLNAQLDGRSIVVPVPKPTKEFREGLIKMATKIIEHGKLQVRTVRKDTLTELKKLKLPEDDTKRLEKDVQKIHDDYIKKLDSLGQQKQKDLMKA